jgi:hypothetical protein
MIHGAVDRLNELFCEKDVNGKPTALTRALLDAERSIVERRFIELQLGCLGFADHELLDVMEALLKALNAFRSSSRLDDAGIEEVARSLAELLRGQPLWAIVEGCNEIRLGTAKVDGKPLSRVYAPNDPEIVGVVGSRVVAFRKLLANAEALLELPVKPVDAGLARQRAEEERLASLGCFRAPRFFRAIEHVRRHLPSPVKLRPKKEGQGRA